MSSRTLASPMAWLSLQQRSLSSGCSPVGMMRVRTLVATHALGARQCVAACRRATTPRRLSALSCRTSTCTTRCYHSDSSVTDRWGATSASRRSSAWSDERTYTLTQSAHDLLFAPTNPAGTLDQAVHDAIQHPRLHDSHNALPRASVSDSKDGTLLLESDIQSSTPPPAASHARPSTKTTCHTQHEATKVVYASQLPHGCNRPFHPRPHRVCTTRTLRVLTHEPPPGHYRWSAQSTRHGPPRTHGPYPPIMCAVWRMTRRARRLMFCRSLPTCPTRCRTCPSHSTSWSRPSLTRVSPQRRIVPGARWRRRVRSRLHPLTAVRQKGRLHRRHSRRAGMPAIPCTTPTRRPATCLPPTRILAVPQRPGKSTHRAILQLP